VPEISGTMTFKHPLSIFLFAIIATLVIVSGCLFKQTIDYKSENRQLILQNDSLTGVVIELNRKISGTSITSLPASQNSNSQNN